MYERIFFGHIPKTAGTSIYVSAVKHFAPEDILYGIHSTELAAMSMSDLMTRRYIQGHFALPLSDRLGKDCFRFMFFREPIERVLSLYNFWRAAYFQYPETYGQGTNPHRVAHQSFEEFLTDEANFVEFTNAQARYLCGDSYRMDVTFDTHDVDKRLAQLNVIGLSDAFDESVIRLNEELGTDMFSVATRANVTPPAVKQMEILKVSDVTRRELDLLKPRLDMDYHVYEKANALFEKRRSPRSPG